MRQERDLLEQGILPNILQFYYLYAQHQLFSFQANMNCKDNYLVKMPRLSLRSVELHLQNILSKQIQSLINVSTLVIDNTSMQISKTENYQYQLSKDIHHRNVINSRPAVHDKIEASTARTIQLTHARPHNRDIPFLQQHQLQFSNKNTIHRLLDIFESNHSPLQAQASYARYNNFERPFRSKNPNRDRKTKEIELQNQKIFKKLSTMKPRIGSVSQWKDHHQKTSTYSKIKSRYQSADKQDNSQLSLYQSNLPEALQELEASLRRIRNAGKGRGGLGVDKSGVRVEMGLPKVPKKSRGKYYDIDLNY